MTLDASYVECDPCDGEYVALGFFARSWGGQPGHLSLARTRRARALGKVYLELDDQSRAAVGGVTCWRLDGGRLRVGVDARAAAKLAIGEHRVLTVTFATAPATVDRLTETLSHLFRTLPPCEVSLAGSA